MLLRPHLTERILTTMGLAAWHEQGRNDNDPIEAARIVSAALDKSGTPAGSK